MESNKKTLAERFSDFVDAEISDMPKRTIREGAIISDDGKLITAESESEKWLDEMRFLKVLNSIRVLKDAGLLRSIYIFLRREYPSTMGKLGKGL